PPCLSRKRCSERCSFPRFSTRVLPTHLDSCSEPPTSSAGTSKVHRSPTKSGCRYSSKPLAAPSASTPKGFSYRSSFFPRHGEQVGTLLCLLLPLGSRAMKLSSMSAGSGKPPLVWRKQRHGLLAPV